MVYHFGYRPNTYPKGEYVERAIRFWRKFLSDKSPDMAVHLENTLEPLPDIFVEFIDTLNLSNVTLNLDIGHTNFISQVPAVEWISRLGRRIAYVHMHDNDGTQDQHAGIGQGTVPFEQVCAALEQHSPQAIWSQETDAPGLDISLAWLRENGYL
jgi:sugar phosphate isomerase/epimerase